LPSEHIVLLGEAIFHAKCEIAYGIWMAGDGVEQRRTEFASPEPGEYRMSFRVVVPEEDVTFEDFTACYNALRIQE
jgi:hypothetical protein